jgi:prepilin-type N-terminal cleavage/methylation domain-containing protein
MLQKLRGNNAEGFTLIELMIVIAIIGILAAIAIPNFISYRDKAFCSAAETDLDSVMGAIADYFADPDNQTVSKANLTGVNLSGDPANDWDVADNAATGGYTVTITDSSGRCPRFTTITKVM